VKVLLFAYYFPPATEVGALRAQKVADSLLKRGHQVFVVAGPVTAGAGFPDLDDFHVHRVEPSLDLRGLYSRMRGRKNGNAVGGGGSVGTAWKPPDRTPFLKRQISSALWLPDDRQGWILPAARTATELVRNNGIDLICSTAPPFSPHLAALLVKRRTGVRWLVEFRDPWTDNPSKPAFVRSAWSDAAERWLEQTALRQADAIVTVTDAFARVLRTRLPAAKASKVSIVRNGIDDLDPPRAPDSHPARHVVYVGSLYGQRDPRPFFRSLARLRARGLLPVPLNVEFIGDCRWLMGESMQNAVTELGLGDIIHFIDPLPHADCLRRIRQADLLLLLAQHQPLQVPNKLYEYLGVRTPVLAFADKDGETAAMLQLIGGHSLVTEDHTDDVIDAVVQAALSGCSPAQSSTAEATLHEWTTARQLVVLNTRLESLLS
jgi:glycosyltransferase involved in cell wall biosynthesis